MADTSKLQMTFNLDNGRTHTITLLDPKADLDAEKVEPVMTSMVSKNALLVGGAMLESVKSAKVVKTITEELF